MVFQCNDVLDELLAGLPAMKEVMIRRTSPAWKRWLYEPVHHLNGFDTLIGRHFVSILALC